MDYTAEKIHLKVRPVKSLWVELKCSCGAREREAKKFTPSVMQEEVGVRPNFGVPLQGFKFNLGRGLFDFWWPGHPEIFYSCNATTARQLRHAFCGHLKDKFHLLGKESPLKPNFVERSFCLGAQKAKELGGELNPGIGMQYGFGMDVAFRGLKVQIFHLNRRVTLLDLENVRLDVRRRKRDLTEYLKGRVQS